MKSFKEILLVENNSWKDLIPQDKERLAKEILHIEGWLDFEIRNMIKKQSDVEEILKNKNKDVIQKAMKKIVITKK